MPYADPKKEKEYQRAYRLAHTAETKAYKTLHRQLHNEQRNVRNVAQRELINSQQRARHAAKREERNTKQRARQAANRDSRLANRTPNDKLRSNLATRLYQFLAGQSRSPRTMQLLGCSLDFLWQHLEKQFQIGMTRDNYGPVWHVDHILPCAEFHLQHSEEREVCFHWTNLQPLFAKDNLSKGAKII